MKLMSKVHRNGGGQSVWDVILIAEAYGFHEKFSDPAKLFGAIGADVRNISSDGIVLRDSRYSVTFFFVGDYKVHCAMLGMKSAVSSYPGPWCRCPLRFPDCMPSTTLKQVKGACSMTICHLRCPKWS